MDVIALGSYEVTVVLDAGPRILGFRRPGGPQLFADLPDVVIDRDGPPFRFLGGHRLWCAPEVPEVTYEPDGPVEVAVDDNRIRVSGSPDSRGLVKAIEIVEDRGRVVVDHGIANHGDAPVRLAPWGITQFTPGGRALMPLVTDEADPAGALPNRSLVLWPYTDPAEIDFGVSMVTVPASSAPTRTKVGSQNRRGWLAYVLGDEMFVKWSALHRDDAEYPDMGSSIEVYRDARFIELETLAPLVTLPPGAEACHREVWASIGLDGAAPLDIIEAMSEDLSVT